MIHLPSEYCEVRLDCKHLPITRMSLEKGLKDKNILVTGAGQGIGRALSLRLYSYGAKVYAVSKSKEPLDSLIKECPNIIPIQLDIGHSWDETRKVVERIKNLDVVINNAACTDIGKPFLDITEMEYDKMFDTNIKAIVNISQSAAKNMIAEKGKGSILNISSVNGLRVLEGASTYCTSKAGLDMLTKCMALELGKHSIRVNAINLGITKTPAVDRIIAGLGDKADAAITPRLAKVVFGQNYLPMDDVVNTMLFVASDLSCTLTGSCIVLDGGLTIS